MNARIPVTYGQGVRNHFLWGVNKSPTNNPVPKKTTPILFNKPKPKGNL